MYTTVYFADEGTVCGGVVQDEIGFIMALDSDGDLRYDLNTDCLWIIQSDNGFKVRYKLESYYLEQSEHCSKDFLAVRFADLNIRGRKCKALKEKARKQLSLIKLKVFLKPNCLVQISCKSDDQQESY